MAQAHHHSHEHTAADGHEPLGNLEECFKSHLDWLTDEQKTQLRQSRNVDENQIQHIVFGFYDRTTGETRQHATEALKDYCSHLFRDIFGAVNAAAVEKLRSDGASSVDVSAAVQRQYQNIEDKTQKLKAKERLPECTKLFGLAKDIEGAGRKRRDAGHGIDETVVNPALAMDQADYKRYKRHNHSDPNHIHDHKEHHDLEDYYKTHLAWLTDAQKAELNALKAEGKARKDLQAKIQEYYGTTTGETYQKAIELLKAGCIELFKSVFGAKKFAEIKKLKESGTPITDIAMKIETFKSELDAEKKAKADKYGPHCKRLFIVSESAAVRRQRSAVHVMAETKRRGPQSHGHPDYPADHADWLSDAQLDALRSARAGGANALQIQVQLFNMYWEIPTKRQRIRANFHLKRDCLGYFTSIVNKLTDKLAALDRRQDQLDPRDVLYVINQMLNTYETHRQGQLWILYHDYCSRIFPKSNDKNSQQIETINDEERVVDSFRQAFDVYVQSDPKAHSWLNEVQHIELAARPDSRTDEERIELLRWLLDWQNLLENDPMVDDLRVIESAIDLKRACVNIAVWFTTNLKNAFNEIVSQRDIGEKALNDGPATLTVINDIDRVFNVIRAANSNWLLRQSTAFCTPMLQNTASGRHRRRADGQEIYHGHNNQNVQMVQNNHNDQDDQKDQMNAEGYYDQKDHVEHLDHHGNHSLEDYFKTYLVWLSDWQKEELRSLKTEGKSQANLQAKVLQFYETTTGETRQNATKLMKDGCIELFKAIFGLEKYEIIRKLKEAGAPMKEITEKVNEFSATLTSEHQKAQMKEYGSQCRSFFFITKATPAIDCRSKLDLKNTTVLHEHEHKSLQEYLDTHLTWLTDSQRQELVKLHAAKAHWKSIYAKVVEYHKKTSGEVQKYATSQLKGACREYFVGVFGEKKLEEIKKLYDDGKNVHEIAATVQGFMDTLESKARREKAELYLTFCKTLFMPAPVDLPVETETTTQLSTNDFTDVEITNLPVSAHSTRVQLVSAQPASPQLISTQPASAHPSAQQINTQPASRRRRETQAHDHDRNNQLKDYYSTHLAWLEDAQKAELDQLKAEGKDIKALTTKIQEYYASATGERKDRATSLLKAGCAELLAEVKQMKESSTSIKEINAQIANFQAELTDPAKKARVEQYGPYCKRLFTGAATTRTIRSLYRKKHRSLLDYFETHLNWLSESQKESLWGCELAGCSNRQMQAMIERFYDELTENYDLRVRAGRLLRSACAEWYTSVFGVSEVEALERLVRVDGNKAAAPERVDALVDRLANEVERQKARDYVRFCRRVGAATESRPATDDTFIPLKHGTYYHRFIY